MAEMQTQEHLHVVTQGDERTELAFIPHFLTNTHQKFLGLNKISVLRSLRIEIKTDAISYRHNNLLQETDKMDSRNRKPFRSGESKGGCERVQEELIKHETRWNSPVIGVISALNLNREQRALPNELGFLPPAGNGAAIFSATKNKNKPILLYFPAVWVPESSLSPLSSRSPDTTFGFTGMAVSHFQCLLKNVQSLSGKDLQIYPPGPNIFPLHTCVPAWTLAFFIRPKPQFPLLILCSQILFQLT